MRRSVWGRRAGPTRRVQIVLFVVLVAIAAIVARHPPAPPRTVIARAEAIDGDTLRVGSGRIRLVGLDAPELDQTCAAPDGTQWSCGREARAFLAGLVGRSLVTCPLWGRDKYGRALARCSVAGQDLGARIVSAGWAVIDDGYAAEQAKAQAGGLGIWQSGFISPAEWRRSHDSADPGVWEWIRSWFQ